MGGQTCLSRHVFEKPPFYASFSVKKKSQQAAGHTAPSAGSRVVALWPSSGPVLQATLLVYARDKIQMVPER